MSSPPTDSAPWSSAGRARWWAESTSWLEETVTALGDTVMAVESVKERPWGAVLRARTLQRVLYLKAVGPGGRHELRIVTDIARGWPELVPTVLAVDEARGWFVMADHGTPMSEVLDGPAQVAVIERLLPTYAQMQAATVDQVDRWLGAGTPDRRVHRLPALLDGLLAGRGRLGPLPLDDDEYRQIVELLPDLQGVCEDLARTSCPDAIDHADLHGTNVLVAGPSARFADWGDCCISHPFSSLFVPTLLVLPLLPAADRSGAMRRLRDAYLEPWGSVSEHREALELAVWVGHVARVVSEDHQSAGASPAEQADARAEIVMLLRRWWANRPRR